MKTIVRREPFTHFDNMEAMFDGLFRGFPATSPASNTTMPLDVYEKEGIVYVRASMPGIDPEHIDITVENNNLTVRGTVNREDEMKDARVYRREITTGDFTRTVRLGDGLDLKNIVAEFDHGVVTVKVPRIPDEKPEILRVPVKAKPIDTGNLDG